MIACYPVAHEMLINSDSMNFYVDLQTESYTVILKVNRA